MNPSRKIPPAFQPSVGRIPIINVFPALPGSPAPEKPSKAYLNEVIPCGATVFREGHDVLGVRIEFRDPTGKSHEYPLREFAAGTDRYQRMVQLTLVGIWQFRIHAFSDDYSSWLRTAQIKIPLESDVDRTLSVGSELLTRAAQEKSRPKKERDVLAKQAKRVHDNTGSAAERLEAASTEELRNIFEQRPLMSLESHSTWYQVNVERTRAGVGSWYEFFPRSYAAQQNSKGVWKSGTLKQAANRLPEIAEMGFDVVYLPPVHPIGFSHRKGRNNTLIAGPHDPGSPWAIGSAKGGHDAIHPELGTLKDFRDFVAAAAKVNIEVALDFALQASPDHPWVSEHPEWFTTFSDGSIAYAENPPKKYQDIFPLNFDQDPKGIRAEALRLIRFWVDAGIRIFRVDNPHTKPFDFWEWLIYTVNAEYPDVVFLAEAFTRPALMNTLAQLGFQQSYTYFTWRNTKEELEKFLEHTAHETAAFLRPNFFVNTPDILTEFLQFGGRPAYKIRAALAATASPSWGVYSGYELYENVARDGSEENIDNEKYEFKPRDFSETGGRSLAPYLRKLNTIRQQHPALLQLRNLQIQHSDDDSILVFSKYLASEFCPGATADCIIVVANLDPHSTRETVVHIDTEKLGLPAQSNYQVTDLLTSKSWLWGAENYVKLASSVEPVHILTVHYPHEKP